MYSWEYQTFTRRQLGNNDDDQGYGYGSDDDGDDTVSWWWTTTGMAVRYAIVGSLFALALLYFVGGYFHALRRLRKGLPPLRYHRWMVQRRLYMMNAMNNGQNNNNGSGGYYNSGAAYYGPPGSQQPGQGGYQMENYPPPPPAYNPQEVPPPTYQPPEGASKVLADQHYHVRAVDGEEGEGAGPAGRS